MADNIRHLPIKRRTNEHVETPLEPAEGAAMIAVAARGTTHFLSIFSVAALDFGLDHARQIINAWADDYNPASYYPIFVCR